MEEEERTLIYELKKYRSPLECKIYVINEDHWFIDIELRKKKTGEITDLHRVIQKDLPGWMSYMNSTSKWEVIYTNEKIVENFCYYEKN